MTVIEKIKEILASLGIGSWRINDRSTETAELFFVKKQLDTRRAKDTRKIRVTVFRDGKIGDKDARGCTDTEILTSDTDEEIRRKLADAYFAAQFAMNPFYELPDAVTSPTVRKKGALAEDPLAVSAGKIASAIFSADTRKDAFVNSAEVFVTRTSVRVLTSPGTDVSYTDARVEGDVVVQCREPEDVEMIRQYSYDECDVEALRALVAGCLDSVADRARAQKILKTGNYDVILCGEQVGEVLSYYGERAHASMIYSRYSTWKTGENVQAGEGGTVAGEPLDMTLAATAPFDAEGIPMKDRPLIRGGVLETVFGPSRFCRYLGVNPTGDYHKILCDNPGSMSFAEMKKTPCLWTVAFSDFQMDSFSGHFGGEIRLAYLIDGDRVIPVTGGSVNGSLIEAQKDLTFSTERYQSADYCGPYAMKLKKISVAGCD